MDDEEYYDEDFEEDEESEGMLLTIGDDGKASIHKESDYVQILESEMDLIRGFLKENKDLFSDWINKHKDKTELNKIK